MLIWGWGWWVFVITSFVLFCILFNRKGRTQWQWQSPRQGVAKREKGGVGALRSRGQCLLETAAWPEGAAGPGVRLLSWLVQCPEAGRDGAGATHARGDHHAHVCSLPGILRWGQCHGTQMGVEAREDAGALRAISA